jgi:dTDP-L-rhamnose 4-epimerase
VGSGRAVTVRDLALLLGAVVGHEPEPELTGEFRLGDVRHCFADISRARDALGFVPDVELEDGIAELAESLEGQAPEDRVDAAAAELARRGLSG